MKFGSVPLTDAEGAVLAHSQKIASGRIPKGTVLSPDNLSALAEAGLAEIVVARLDNDDVPENTAAERLATALVPDPTAQIIRLGGAGTGRVNLFATCPGVVMIDRAAVNAVNAVDPMITLATVPEYHRADAEGMIATIKIISYAVPDAALRRAEEAASAALRVAPARFSSATLIETVIAADGTPGKGREAMVGRLDRLGVTLTERVVVPHAEPALAAALQAAPGEVVMVLTGSATSDIDDVAPAALRLAGGAVERFGMPVDPGNLLFLGNLGDRPVIGLPGCARSPALNGADWVLERVICGVPVRDADIAAMGVGGLLKEIPTRPQPRRG